MTSAASITVRETLELLETEFAAFADGVANGRYVFWLGSGISVIAFQICGASRSGCSSSCTRAC